MKKVYSDVIELIGNTPLLELKKLKKAYGLKANIYAKLEGFNPAGSVKDRVALSMLKKAKEQGLINENSTIVEPTSGNTGIGLAMLCSVMGYKCVIVMPDTMSIERIKMIEAYGAKVILTDGKLGMNGAIEKAKEILSSTKDAFVPLQFENKANPLAHYETTGREIEEALDGEVDFFVAGIGTGGTLCGSAKYLKEKLPNVKIIGVEPESSPVITKGVSGAHKIQGIGANFIPKNYDSSCVDQVMTASDQSAFEFAREVAKVEGVLVGISSGASLSVAVEIAKREENKDKNVVVIFPDSGDKYLSTELFCK
ncbi:MAG: cysteine synthase A [Clostridia bacterium]|nr:cysteine synthase A [Clostridia bacterium]